MSFRDYKELSGFFVASGVKRAYFKLLAENDNCKQQIYLGGSFEAINRLPFGAVKVYTDLKKPNFKASVDLYWIDDNRNIAKAPNAQLILYPKYPEVRLSGFLSGCPIAPSSYMQPVPASERRHNNEKDGRVLIFGITEDRRIFLYLAIQGSPVAESLNEISCDENNIFNDYPLMISDNSRTELIKRLKDIHTHGWYLSRRLDGQGNLIMPYNAQNGGGYTLEALFNLVPNGKAEPDFMGWELKAHSSSRLTLMTPEPDAGFYGDHGVKEFVIKYGHETGNDVLYFTGTHKVGEINSKTELGLFLNGFDQIKNKITDLSGGIVLSDKNGFPAAVWSFRRLIEHWGRKHAKTVYVNFEKAEIGESVFYSYNSPVYLCEGTDFSLFLTSMKSGHVIYDPGSKVMNVSGKSRVKARSQFRIGFKQINALYKKYDEINLN